MSARRDWTTDLGIGVVGLAAAILTFTTLKDLGTLVGITYNLFGLFSAAWLLPITIDAAGIVAARVWLRGEAHEEAVDFARYLTLGCIGLSVAGNAGQHVMSAFHIPVPWWAVVLVTAVPPAMLGAVVHLGHMLGRAQRERTQEQAEDVPADVPVPDESEWVDPWERWGVPALENVPAPVPAAVPVPVLAAPENVPAAVPAVVPVPVPAAVPAVPASDQGEQGENITDEDIVEWLQERAREDRVVPGIRAIRTQFPVGAGRADRLRKTVSVPGRMRSVK